MRMIAVLSSINYPYSILKLGKITLMPSLSQAVTLMPEWGHIMSNIRLTVDPMACRLTILTVIFSYNSARNTAYVFLGPSSHISDFTRPHGATQDGNR